MQPNTCASIARMSILFGASQTACRMKKNSTTLCNQAVSDGVLIKRSLNNKRGNPVCSGLQDLSVSRKRSLNNKTEPQ